ncbi:hypothetical protein HDU98_000446 [Podochytrium sp. JEL0797]|nr:hypothetical protein HDU98_000446 [Podochytrium sp. JEL0797]
MAKKKNTVKPAPPQPKAAASTPTPKRSTQPPASKPASKPTTVSTDPFVSLDSINDITDLDLDLLLTNAASALEQNARASEEEERKKKEEDVKNGIAVVASAAPSRLTSIKLNPLLDPKSTSYLTQTSDKGAVRLNPAKFAIVETTSGGPGGSSLDVSKGLGRGDAKGMLDRIVVNKPVVGVAPEVDLDAKQKKKLVKETSGPKWFNMPAPELTDKLKLELQIIKARNVLDPKHHYKRADKNAPEYPKYFQMGTVIEGAGEFKSARIVNRDRKEGFVAEVMGDDKTKAYVKRKYGEIQEKNIARSARPTSKKRKSGPAASKVGRK